MNYRRLLLGLFVFSILFGFHNAEAKTVIKFATLAPTGSSWDKIMREYDAAVRAKTGGAVEFSIYSGGVMGDEPVIVQKLGINQVQAAGFTGVGLGKIAPAVRVMEAPMLFKDYGQVDRAFAAVGSELEGFLLRKGYVVLGWAHPGMVKILSKKKIDSPATLTGAKVWIWAGDPIAEEMAKALKFNPNPLGLPDVLTSLQTGLIDTVYCPGLACLALQWYTKIKFITDLNLVHSMGAMIIRKDALAKLAPAHQKIVKDLGRQYMQRLTTQTRAENRQSVQAMKSSGVKVISVTPENYQPLYQAAQQVWSSLGGRLYPPALLEKVKAAR